MSDTYLNSDGSLSTSFAAGSPVTADYINELNKRVNSVTDGIIMGIKRNVASTSPDWTRTDDSIGKTFSASVGSTAGSSDFDTMPIYKDIKRVTLVTGDVMVQIPKFYFQRYVSDGVEYIRISALPKEGFILHPAFNRPDGVKDYIYVGAYKTGTGHMSKSGLEPLVSITRATFRTNAHSKGAGWAIIDLATISAIQMLIVVEIASNDSQGKIGRGICDNSWNNGTSPVTITAGLADGVAKLTGRTSGTNGTTAQVIWRGIEAFWGTVWEWFDGLNVKDGAYYYCNDIDAMADDTETNYEKLGFSIGTSFSGSYIKQNGMDDIHPGILLPSDANASASTYFCDGLWTATGWRVALRGGSWSVGSLAGLWSLLVYYAASFTGSGSGSRLLYIPS